MSDQSQNWQLILLISSIVTLLFLITSIMLFRLYLGVVRKRNLYRQQLDLALDNSPDCIILLRHNHILRVNQRATRLFGRSNEALSGVSLLALLGIEDPEAAQALQDGTPYTFAELTVQSRSGQPVELEGKLSPAHGEHHRTPDSPTGVLILKDVSERQSKQTQESRNHLVLAAVSQVNNDFLLYKDPKRRFGELLETLKKLTDSPMGFIGERIELNGKPILRCYAITNLAWDQASHDLYVDNIERGIDFPSLDNLFGHTIMTGEVVISNHHDSAHRANSCPAGHPDLVSFIGIPLKFRGEVLGMYGLANRANGYEQALVELLAPLTDTITGIMYAFRVERDRHESEQKLLHARDEAEQANELKSDFLATMSHEIRTPLNAVVGMLDSLEATDLNADQTDYVESALVAADTLLHLINNVLDFSKIEADMLTLLQEPLNLCECIHAILAASSISATTKGVELYLNYDPEAPLNVIGDPVRLSQILNNLIDNAIKFTESGHVTVSVDLHKTDDHEPPRFIITVEDTGIGIARHDLAIIFDAFRQIDHSITRRYQGTGLGLSITRDLVKAMGGHLDVKSTLGVGSRFIIELPLKAASPATLNSQLAQLSSLSTHRLLCVTNSHQLFEYLHRLLAPHLNLVDCHFIPLEQEPDTRHYTILLADDRRFPLAPERLRNWIHQTGGEGELIGLSQRDLAQSFIPITAQLHPPLSPLQLLDTLALIVQPDLALSDSSHTAASDAQPESPSKPFTADLSILIAEDHPINQKMMEILMQRINAHYRVCNDGLEVVQTMQSGEHYDLILMDLHMPNMDGYEATRSIRDLPGPERTIPIIAVTADALAGDREKCLAAGMDDYLAKPVRLADLQQVITRTLDARPACTSTINTPESAEPDTFSGSQLIAQVGDAESAALLAREFANTLRPELQILQQALDMDDLEAARSAAHRIKGSARTIGCDQLAALMQQVEFACRSDNKNDANQYLSQVMEQLPALLEILHAFSQANTRL